MGWWRDKAWQNDPRSFNRCFCDGHRHLWLTHGQVIEELNGETVEKVSISSSTKADQSHVVPLGAPVVEVLHALFILVFYLQ